MSDKLFTPQELIKIANDKIEELRKDVNYYDQQVNSRINNMHNYFSAHIARLELQLAEKDAKIKMMWEQIDRLERKVFMEK